MRNIQIAQLAAAILAVVTPWVVVRTAAGVAARHAAAVAQPFADPPAIARLGRATIAALATLAAVTIVPSARGPWTLAVGLSGFAVLAAIGMVALAAIDAESRSAREVSSTVRSAALRPRRVDQFVPRALRVMPYAVAAIGVAALAWRLAEPVGHRQPLVPLGFAGASLIFLWLYEVWIVNLVRDPALPGDGESRRARAVRRVYAGELALVTIGMSLAHALLDLHWPLQGGWGTTLALGGAVAGVIGCAFAVSSDLTRTKYTS